MENNRKKIRAMTIAFITAGIAFINEMTAIFRLSLLDITLNGLSTLSSLSTLMNGMLMVLKMMESTENKTMTKSMMFQEIFR